MIAAALVLVVLVGGLGVYIICRGPADSDPEPALDPAALTKTATELHRIRRSLDVALACSEIRREAARVRREIEEALNEYRP